MTPLSLALGGAALLLIAGAMVAHFFPSRTPTLATVTTPAASPAADTSTPAHQLLTVADVGAIAASLRDVGVDATIAAGAAQEVGSVLGTAAGDIHLAVDLTGSASAREMTRLEATRDTHGVVLTAKPDGSYSSEPTPARLTTGM